MRSLTRFLNPPGALFGLLVVAILVAPFPGSSAPAVHRIALDARQYEFFPGRFEVNYGDTVILTLTASDVVHGFYLDGYSIERRLEPGITQQIEFTATQPGKFRYRCSVSCGAMHPFMIGELVVGPNIPFWRAAGVLGLALMGMLVSIWKGSSSDKIQKTS